jgi:hypothetical protein
MSDQRSATIAYTAMALVAFAANSVLCRMALREGRLMPPASRRFDSDRAP